jgi:hypothetical protein
VGQDRKDPRSIATDSGKRFTDRPLAVAPSDKLG